VSRQARRGREKSLRKPVMRASTLRLAVSLSAILALLACPIPQARAGNAKVCRNQEQRYEQIEQQASSMENTLALFSAADKGCLDLAKRLLDAGASAEARDRLGASPLAHAAVAGEPELVTLFLDHGASVDAQNLEGSTALYQAAENGRLPIVKLLIERGANVSLPGRNGIMPLSAAAYMGSVPIIELLIEKGADPKTTDATSKAAIIYAAGPGFPLVLRLLRHHRLRVNARDGHDRT